MTQQVPWTPTKRYTAAELDATPTIEQRQAVDVKIMTDELEVTLSRMGIGDGVLHENEICEYRPSPMNDGRWFLAKRYAGGPRGH